MVAELFFKERVNDLSAKLKNKDHVSCLQSLASRLFSEFFQLSKLKIFRSPRAFTQEESHIDRTDGESTEVQGCLRMDLSSIWGSTNHQERFESEVQNHPSRFFQNDVKFLHSGIKNSRKRLTLEQLKIIRHLHR